MLGVCLLFVGIVLINNGMCTLYHVDGKSAAVMNILTGGLSVVINVLNLIQGNYYAAGTGLLFGFTYLFVAFNNLLNLSAIPFAWFSTFVAINFRNTGRFCGQCSIKYYAGLALGSHLVSLGHPLGNRLCGDHL